LDKASEIDDIVWEELLPTVVKRIAKRRVKLTDDIPRIKIDVSLSARSPSRRVVVRVGV
jgi:hypothetical protein